MQHLNKNARRRLIIIASLSWGQTALHFIHSRSLLIVLSHPNLVQCCLGNRVVFYAEPVFIGHHQLKYPRQGGRGDLVLQRVVVLLPLDAAGEAGFHKTLHGLQLGGQAGFGWLDFHCDYVAVTKSKSGKYKMKTFNMFSCVLLSLVGYLTIFVRNSCCD